MTSSVKVYILHKVHLKKTKVVLKFSGINILEDSEDEEASTGSHRECELFAICDDTEEEDEEINQSIIYSTKSINPYKRTLSNI